jgi:Site-specific recombinase XerD
MKILDAFAEFTRNYLQVRQSSSVTIDGYWWVIKSFINVNGNIPVCELDQQAFGCWVEGMIAKGNTKSSISSNIARFKVFIKYLELAHECKLSASSIKTPRAPKTLPKYVTAETVQKLIQNASNARDKAIIALLFSSGLRSNEIRTLERRQIKNKTISVSGGKGDRDRITYMDDRARQLLNFYFMTRFDKSPYVFTSAWGNQLGKSTLRAIIDKACKQAGTEHLSPHMFRHGIATHLLDQGMNIRMIQKLLGHSYISTTQIYLHVKDLDLEKSYNKCLDDDNNSISLLTTN